MRTILRSDRRQTRLSAVRKRSSRLAYGHRRRRREAALTTRARRYSAGRGNEAGWHWMGVVAFAADHQLPGDARRFVGERHRGELGWLAPDQPNQPGRGMSFS